MDLLSQGVLQEWRPHDWESISYPMQTNKNSKWSFWHLFINELMTRAETNRREMLSILWVSHCATALMNDNDAIITSFSKSTRLDERHYGIFLNTSKKKNLCVKNLKIEKFYLVTFCTIVFRNEYTIMITAIHKEVHVHSFANKTITIKFLKMQQEDFP